MFNINIVRCIGSSAVSDIVSSTTLSILQKNIQKINIYLKNRYLITKYLEFSRAEGKFTNLKIKNSVQVARSPDFPLQPTNIAIAALKDLIPMLSRM